MVSSAVTTFLFTDVEGSTRLWVADEASMAASLRVHDELLRSVIEAHEGYVFSTAGDSFAVAFGDAEAAIACAVEVQDALASAEWPGPALRVRIGLHRGRAEERDGDFFGSVVSTAARVEAAAHGGQIVCSEVVRAAVDRDDLVDRGVHRLRDVAEPTALFQVGDGEFPALRVVPPQLIRLPAPANPLVGQEEVVRSIRAALLDRRLVTLTGVGGSGKTRLAMEVGEEEIPHFPDGVVFVDLAAVSDPDEVPAAVLAAADIKIGPDETATEAVVRWVSDRQVLLIVDNCEHVIDDAAELVEALLSARTETRVLATSREMLDVDGEQVVQVPSLETAPDGPAVRLFLDRARAVGAVTDPADPAVVEVCEHLDGMPLALELAAVRTATMTPTELLERLADRFSLLARSGRRRRGHSRQRTLEATIDWSYALLTSEEQALFRACSVFDDEFDLVDACGAAGIDPADGADVLAGLAAKSLVTVRHAAVGARYRLLETLRAYGEQKLLDHDETRTVRRRLVDHVASRYVPTDDRILHESRWGMIEVNNRTVTTALGMAEDFDLPPDTRVRLLISSLLRQSNFTEVGHRRRASVQLPDGIDPESPVARFAQLVVALRGRLFRGDPAGALELLTLLEQAPHPWPWTAIASRLRIQFRQDPDELVRRMPAPTEPEANELSDRVRMIFHGQAVEALGGLDRDLALAHLDRLDANPLHDSVDRIRVALFRHEIEGAWAGPGNVRVEAPEVPFRHEVRQFDELTPYRDGGEPTTRTLAAAYETTQRDPSNHMNAAQALVLLATAAEVRGRLDLMRQAVLAVRRVSIGVLSTEIITPVIARRHGFLDELVARDLDDDEVHRLGQVFLDLAPQLDPSITDPRSGGS